GLVWLDSGGPPRPPARWSAIALLPLEVLAVRVGAGRLAGGSPDPFAALQDLYDRGGARLIEGAARASQPTASGTRWARPAANEALPAAFAGGVSALVGSDAGRAIEKIPALAVADPALPDRWAGGYDAALVFDRAEKRAYVTRWAQGASKAARALEEIARDAAARPAARETRIGEGETRDRMGAAAMAGLAATRRPDAGAGREDFLAGVARIREEIARGEIYQANLTRRILARAALAEAPALYERLRTASPTPFGAYVDAGSFRVLSASPERFLRLGGGIVETCPIKGTRPRGSAPAEDEALR